MKRISSIYISFQTFFNLLLWIPIFYEFQKQIGLSDQAIFTMQSIYYFSFCVFEIPTGFLADRWGYRQCLRLAALLLTAANLLPALYPTYVGCLIHFLLISMSRSLISGAASAYLYEYLQTHEATHLYKQIEGKARAYSLIAKVASWAVVGYLFAWHFASPYWLSALCSLLALVCASLLPKQSIADMKTLRGRPGQNSFLQAFHNVFRSPILLLIIAGGIGIFVMARVFQINLYQPMLREKSCSVEYYGWIMSLMTACEAFGAWRAHALRRYVSDLNAIYLATLVIAASLSWIAAADSLVVILVALAVFSLGCGIAFPIQKQLLNDNIRDSGNRATVLSIESIFDRTFSALAVLPLGGVVASGQLAQALYVTTAVAIISMSAVYIALRYGRSSGLAKF